MLLHLAKYDLTAKYIGAKSVLLADTLSRLMRPGADKVILGLDVNIATVMKIRPVRLQSLQEETKADAVLRALTELITTDWPDSMQDLQEDLHPFWCFRDELTILNGLVMKENQVIIPANMRLDTLKRLHDAH